MCTCQTDYDIPEFSHVQRVRARKTHECSECARTIAAGDMYIRETSKFDWEFATYITCVDCDAWSKELYKWQRYVCGCSGYLLGSLWLEIADYCEVHLHYSAGGEWDAATDRAALPGLAYPNQPQAFEPHQLLTDPYLVWMETGAR
jgi:hypothetical protein